MKRIICVALFLFTIALLAPALADAKISPRKSQKSVACGAGLKLGATARRHHSGSRKVKVNIYNGKRLVYKRTVRATKNFTKKHIPCGKHYRVVYRMPSGRKVTRLMEVRRGAGADGQGLPVEQSDETPLTPAEQQEDAQDAADDACDILNEQHEDDDNWDPDACMSPDTDTGDEFGDDPTEDDEGDTV